MAETDIPFADSADINIPFSEDSTIEVGTQNENIWWTPIDEIINKFQDSWDFVLFGYARYLSELKEWLSEENIAGLTTILRKFSSTDDQNEIEVIMSELAEATSGYRAEIEANEETARVQRVEAQQANLQDLLNEARSIELKWHIEAWDWAEVMPILQAEMRSLNIELSDEELQKFQNVFDAMKKNAEWVEVSLQTTNSILDNIIDQAEEHGDDSEFSITISQNNFVQEGWEQAVSFISAFSPISFWTPSVDATSFEMTFPNSESAIQFALWVKTSLQEIEDINLYDWSTDILLDALVFTAEGVWEIDQAVFAFVLEDLDYSFTNGVWIFAWSAIVHGLWYYYLKTKLDAANSGIRPEAIDWLVNQLKETIRLYKSAGYESSEIRNMETLLSELTDFFPETPEGINNQKFRAKYVYSVLQKWRGRVPMDMLRFGSSGIGRVFDVDIWSRESLLWKIPIAGGFIQNIPLVWRALDLVVKVHAAPLIMGSKLINKGPNGWGIFNTKSGVINNYSDSIKNANDTFTRFFAIIDSISEFSAAERTSLKRDLLDLYRAGSKPDPIRETRAWIDFSNTIPRLGINLDQRAAQIISWAIESRLWYIPEHLQETFAGIRRNGDAFERERTNVDNAKNIFLRFIDYYPGISDAQERSLTSMANIESLTSENAENFNIQMVNILKEHFLIDVSGEYIKDFSNMVQHESINTGENRNNAKIIEQVNEILDNMRDAWTIEEADHLSRSENARAFFRGNKTFWHAHLSLIIQEIIDGKNPSGVSSLVEVERFIADGWSRDTFSHLRSISRNSWVPSVETISTEIIDTPSTNEAPERPVESTSPRRWLELYFSAENLRETGNARALYAVSFMTGISVDELKTQIPWNATPAVTRDAINAYLDGKHSYRMETSLNVDELKNIQIDLIARSILHNWADINTDLVSRFISDNLFIPSRQIGNILGLNMNNIPNWDSINLERSRLTPEQIERLNDVRRSTWSEPWITRWRAVLDALKRIA